MRKNESSIQHVEDAPAGVTVGLDLGDKWAQLCAIDQDGEIIDEGRIKLTHGSIRTRFENQPRTRIALEAGTHSLWVSTLLTELGHEVIVANAREVTAITGSNRKSDRNDAVKLARYARVDPSILCPIQHRSVQSQVELSLIRARAALVRARTLLINTARGIAKPLGYRLPACTSKAFAAICRKQVPKGLSTALSPLLDQVERMTNQIAAYDAEIAAAAATRKEELTPLTSVHGVGTLTALTFVLTVGDKHRFQKSRDVACYLGLQPKRSQSGECDPRLGITKAGNCYLRTLLVECSQHILGPYGRDSALRRWGVKLAERGGKGSKRKAVVAVARKLAVLLHRLWLSRRSFEPLHGVVAAA